MGTNPKLKSILDENAHKLVPWESYAGSDVNCGNPDGHGIFAIWVDARPDDELDFLQKSALKDKFDIRVEMIMGIKYPNTRVDNRPHVGCRIYDIVVPDIMNPEIWDRLRAWKDTMPETKQARLI